MLTWPNFKNFLKVLLFVISTTAVVYFSVDLIQEKNNLMDIEEYNPTSSLVVEQNPKDHSKFPFVDVHSHQWKMPVMDLSDLVADMDSLNMGYMINLSGSGFGTFAGNQDLMDVSLTKSIENVESQGLSNRFGVFVNVDLNKIDEEDFAENNVSIIKDAVKQGAIGLKVYKNLGLNLKDNSGARVKVDDKRLNPIWEVCGELKIPVLIHSGEPSPFFDPIDKYNERWLHARQKPASFRSPDEYPSFEVVMQEQYNMFESNPNTIFINAHLGWYGNDLDKLSEQLDNLPNVYTEIGAVIAELGRQPIRAKKFFVEHQDRVLFGKDTYRKSEYNVYFRILETSDEYFDYYRKRHAHWKMYGLNLPDSILKKLYYKNALRLFPSIPADLFKIEN
ncbi:MAG: amidohydrolase family protein [Flavobacteriales bacterium]|jgi:predicted TIM-barrel fold metal-dependent hydrolase|tara:strand:- start:114358 stop:115530 length:1173 start_codon:yes stop_codon:yes gene_type:complete